MPEQHENILGAIDRHRSDEIGTGPFDLGRTHRRCPHGERSAAQVLRHVLGHGESGPGIGASGTVAGVYARTDATRGVRKAVWMGVIRAIEELTNTDTPGSGQPVH